MIRCANETCDKNPLISPTKIVVTIDGDFVCGEDCKEKYEQQKAKFFGETIHSEIKFNAWIIS